ncbi:four-helix bundle copper-binding protein [Arthrobacter sp. BB-1]|uniref:four-helix bundle copper-binding protein n=1 Tax=unclassified Arthrobacter TaxID=235627 RepID=UPI001112AF28|nr:MULTISPECIES: four-helix bundle copper-binding protein [unclassified Arthrobacter]TNB75670.1 four-helix bundle copper-binding protein [Arthrobacter sp. BB-1]
MPLIEDQTRQLINTLGDCLARCTACARDCAGQGDKDLASCIQLCSDCAELCGVCIPLIARGSDFTDEMCRVCADACERCAQECERTGMNECAEACRAAAEACRQMASA